MSAPVTSPSPSPAASALSGATTASPSVSLNPLGNPLFGSMLSRGLANFTMTSTTPAQTTDATTTAAAANTDAKSALFSKSAFSLQQTLMISSDDLNSMSEEDLKSLLASFGDASDELTPKILVALAPGVPAQEAFENIKAKFAELGVDTSKFASVPIKLGTTETPVAPGTTPQLPTDGTAPAVTMPTGEDALTVGTADAAQAVNFLLVTTGLTPSEMGPTKVAIKALVDENGNTIAVPSMGDDSDTDTTDGGTDISAAQSSLVMMVYVTPQPKPIEAPAAQDISFDFSAMSAFTPPLGSDVEEPDWTKKLSDKLSTMSLTDNASPFDADVSPFDDEMNAILSLSNTPKETSAGFQGSIASTGDDKKDADKPKTVAGEVSAQALLALNHTGALSSAALHHLSGDALLTANGNMLNAQNMSSLSNPIFTSGSAIGTHPSVQAVAQLIEKAASGSEKAKQELTVQLDPPELGRMQVHLSMEKDGAMKVHLLTEKQETLSLFQRDAHALKSALDNAGIQIDNSSLTFDMASSDQSFNQLMGGSQDNQSRNGQSSSVMGIRGGAVDANDMTNIDTKMDFVPNSITGNVHYSFWA